MFVRAQSGTGTPVRVPVDVSFQELRAYDVSGVTGRSWSSTPVT